VGGEDDREWPLRIGRVQKWPPTAWSIYLGSTGPGSVRHAGERQSAAPARNTARSRRPGARYLISWKPGTDGVQPVGNRVWTGQKR
jgi:hypothetical protein